MFEKLMEALEGLSPDVWAEYIEAALSEEGVDGEEVGRMAGQKLDESIDFTLLLPAPAGQILEMFDDKIFEAIITRAVEDIESPEERAAVLRGLRTKIEEGSESRKAKRRARRKAHPTIKKVGTPGHTE